MTTYILKAIPENVAKKRTRPITIYVANPETVAAFNTTQMAYSMRRFHVGYFSQNQWAETPSQMLQPLLIESLQKTHFFHAVVPASYSGYYDYILSTEILNLIQDYRQRPVKTKITVRAQLTRVTTNKVVATKQIAVWTPLAQYTPYGGVVAANQAMVEVLSQITEMCLLYAR